MRKYMILAIVPLLFYNTTESKKHVDTFAQVDQSLMPLYEKACHSFSKNTKREFEPMMRALINEAHKGGNKRPIAIGYIMSFENALQMYKAEENRKLSSIARTFGYTSTTDLAAIEDALKQIKKAKKDLKISLNESSIAAKIAIAALAAAGLVAAGLAYRNRDAIAQAYQNTINAAGSAFSFKPGSPTPARSIDRRVYPEGEYEDDRTPRLPVTPMTLMYTDEEPDDLRPRAVSEEILAAPATPVAPAASAGTTLEALQRVLPAEQVARLQELIRKAQLAHAASVAQQAQADRDAARMAESD